MSSGKWQPFCLGLDVINAVEKHKDTSATVWEPHLSIKE